MDLPLLYQTHCSSAMAVAFRILHDAAEAEDAVQDTFLGLLRGAHEFRPERGSERGWITMLVRNRALDRLRSRAGRARMVASVAIEAARSQTCDEGALERDVLERALAQLKAGQRQVVELFYFGDLSHREIALRTNTPLGTVKTRIRLGIEQLARLFDEVRSSERRVPRQADEESGEAVLAFEVHAAS